MLKPAYPPSIPLNWVYKKSNVISHMHAKATYTVYPKKYAHGFCFAVLCCGYTLTDFPISIRLTSVALWQSNDCPSASKATLMNMDKYFMWIHYEWLHNHNKAKHNKTVCIFLGIYCIIVYTTGTILQCILNYWYASVIHLLTYHIKSIHKIHPDIIVHIETKYPCITNTNRVTIKYLIHWCTCNSHD